jgi:hypothetical protein
VPNQAPVANDQSVITDEDTAVAITLTATDANADPLTYSIITPPTHGSLSGTPPNVTYTPDFNYNGPDSFTFKANDGTADSNIATVSITINPVNDAPVANEGCPTCDGTVVTVDQDVTVDFNQVDPNDYYIGDPDLLPYFSYDVSGLTPDTWKAIFTMGAKKLLVKNGATITTVPVHTTESYYPAPGIVIKGTCDLEIVNGSTIKVVSPQAQAGDIFIQVDGNIIINGEVRNETTGTTGMPGKITIGSCCGDITVGSTGRVYDLGVDPGGNEINIVTCCGCQDGDITINGLVMAFAHAHGADQTEATRPRIRVASFTGSVTINANTTEQLRGRQL